MANQTTLTPGSGYGNPYVDSLVWGCQWTEISGGFGPGTVANPIDITYSFGSGLAIGGLGPLNGVSWLIPEQNAFNNALQLYENICNINFVQTSYTSNYSAQSNIVFYLVPASYFGGDQVLGMFEVPDASYTSNYGYFNYQNTSWSNLNQGSYGFITIIHELGHGLGLAHPHDGGSEPGASTFPGVTSSSSTGTYGLNQGIFTVMTYVDGWDLQPAISYNYGWQGTPMAFDIAALQAIYGVNTSYQTGSNTYSLPTSNGAGTYWSCIWDAGGLDTISNAGSSSACTINLNAAPLTGQNAGGYVSWIPGVIGGFTIANGVVIENAVGGSGDDSLTGNSGNNILNGGAGIDTLIGGAGDDTYVVDSTTDTITELSGGGTDTVQSSVTYTLAVTALANVENLTLTGTGVINGIGNALDNILTGNSGNNILNGGAGIDTLIGGAGKDSLTGGSGADTFVFGNILESGITPLTQDTITDFSFVQGDKIDLTGIDAMTGGSPNDTFVFSNSAPLDGFSNGMLWYQSGVLYASNNDDAYAEFSVAVNLTGITATNVSEYILM